MDFYKSDIPIIDDSTHESVFRPSGAGFGCVPRDYDCDPIVMMDTPDGMRLYEESEWDALYDEQEENESSLEHLFLRGGTPAFVNLDQDGDGHCWAYSPGHAYMLDQLKQNLPVPRLNPHSIATMLQRFDGGWCGLSMKFLRTYGCAEEGNGPGLWPLHSNDSRYATPECRAIMVTHRSEEDWYDMGRKEWDQVLSRKQLATCGFLNIPAPSDFNWWGHSVCQVRWVRIEPGSWGPLILNSWKGWGRFGLGVLRGTKAKADNAVALRRGTS